MKGTNGTTQTSPVRCAIYTRKSTDENLDKDFNSLDAQREAAESFIASRKSLHWICLPERYDDGGFTGGNLERPALQRLLGDVENRTVDCIVVHRVDRLSRSLLDFARIMDALDRNGASFASVSQPFDTTNSMGRLTLNVLLSFAQFEREIIAERTRDKISAARRKGKWTGGPPILGYDLDPGGGKLIVNQDEAGRVREIFELYLSERGLLPVVSELAHRSWLTKSWVTRQGKSRPGSPFDKNSLYRLLTNPIYSGYVTQDGKLYPGEHQAIVGEELWKETQETLRKNGGRDGKKRYEKYGSMLAGILRCKPCGCAMVHSYSSKRSGRRYRYYTCAAAQKRGWDSCPTKSVSAPDIEREIVERIRWIGRDSELISRTVEHARAAAQQRIEALENQLADVRTQIAARGLELRNLIRDLGDSLARDDRDHDRGSNPSSPTPQAPSQHEVPDRLAEIQGEMKELEQNGKRLSTQIARLREDDLSTDDVAGALSSFDPVWNSLNPREQWKMAKLILETVAYDGSDGTVEITFRANGLKRMAMDPGMVWPAGDPEDERLEVLCAK